MESVDSASFKMKSLAIIPSMQRSGLPLLRLYKKKTWDMATPDFQRLVRMDPENVSCVANSDECVAVRRYVTPLASWSTSKFLSSEQI